LNKEETRLETTNTGEKITFGVVETLTGNAAFYGTQTQKGIDLAVDYLRETYPDYDFDLYHQGAEATPKDGIDAYNSLKQQYDLDVVLTQSSPVSFAVQPIIKEDGLFQMAITASANSFSTPDDLSFRVSALTSDEAYPMVNYIAEKGYKKLAILYFQNEVGVSMSESLISSINEVSPETEIVLNEGFAITEQDFRTLIAKTKEKNPDAVYLAGVGSNIGNILNQSKELGLETNFLSFRIAEDPTLLDVAGENADGIVYTYGFDNQDAKPLVKNFVNKFKEKYGVLPDGYNAESFMGMRLTGEAFRTCGKDYQCVSDFLTREEGHDSIFGKVNFDENGDISHEFFLKTVENGEFVRL
ncbi:ABC transporter substrate-binding protein, partial [Candidatus Pacebacteria bacterium]|nr:ABC transporter substrate-binding protein [Candidatus Paceibacterota bacterium]